MNSYVILFAFEVLKGKSGHPNPSACTLYNLIAVQAHLMGHAIREQKLSDAIPYVDIIADLSEAEREKTREWLLSNDLILPRALRLGDDPMGNEPVMAAFDINEDRIWNLKRAGVTCYLPSSLVRCGDELGINGGHMEKERDIRDAMSMAAMLLSGATWRRNGSEDKWVMTAIYHDGRVAMTRERDGFSQKFAPHVIAEQFSSQTCYGKAYILGSREEDIGFDEEGDMDYPYCECGNDPIEEEGATGHCFSCGKELP